MSLNTFLFFFGIRRSEHKGRARHGVFTILWLPVPEHILFKVAVLTYIASSEWRCSSQGVLTCSSVIVAYLVGDTPSLHSLMWT